MAACYIMGATESKTTVNALSSAISEVVMNTMQSCEVAAEQDQSLVVANTGFKLWGDYKLEQKTEIRSSCFSDSKKQTELQTKIINAITQAASSSNIALLGAFGSTKASAESNLTNIIKNSVTMNNIQSSYTAIKQKQAAVFTNSGVIAFEKVELVQGAQLFAAATLQELDKAGVFNTIESHVDQQAKAVTENPLDFIAKAFGAITSSLSMSILMFALLLFMPLVLILGLFRGGGDQQPPQVIVAQPQDM